MIPQEESAFAEEASYYPLMRAKLLLSLTRSGMEDMSLFYCQLLVMP